MTVYIDFLPHPGSGYRFQSIGAALRNSAEIFCNAAIKVGSLLSVFIRLLFPQLGYLYEPSQIYLSDQ